MKKIIRWLSDLSGVTYEIRKETLSETGNALMSSSYYYGNEHLTVAGNALYIYGMHIRKDYFIDDNKICSALDDIKPNNIHGDNHQCAKLLRYYKNTLQ